MYIEDQEALEAFVERARRSSVLAIDTEFLREKTYYARLCLIQFATDDEVAVVDPFCMEDLHVLAPLLEDAGVMKVLHSGGQDLEILWHEVGVLPQPLFDTQVAAALLGLDPEFAEMCDPARFESDERERYRRLKRVGQLSRKQLAAAREVAAWREVTAQKRNVPRKWVITDEQIVEACKREARTIDDLFMVRGMREKLNTRDARTVAGLMKKALESGPQSWPELDRSGRNEPNVDAPLDLMSALVRLRAKENGVAFPTLASHDDLVRMARGYRQGIDLLRGWRRALVGEELIELLEGKLVLSLDGHDLRVTRLDGEE